MEYTLQIHFKLPFSHYKKKKKDKLSVNEGYALEIVVYEIYNTKLCPLKCLNNKMHTYIAF